MSYCNNTGDVLFHWVIKERQILLKISKDLVMGKVKQLMFQADSVTQNEIHDQIYDSDTLKSFSSFLTESINTSSDTNSEVGVLIFEKLKFVNLNINYVNN